MAFNFFFFFFFKIEDFPLWPNEIWYKIPTYNTKLNGCNWSKCENLPVPPPLAPQSGLEIPLKAWRSEDGVFRSDGLYSLSLSFLTLLVLSLVYALAVFSKNYLKTSWHSPILPFGMCEESAFIIPNKAEVERLTFVLLNCSLFLSWPEKRGHNLWTKDTPILGQQVHQPSPWSYSEHSASLWASNSPESVAALTKHWTMIQGSPTVYGLWVHSTSSCHHPQWESLSPKCPMLND